MSNEIQGDPVTTTDDRQDKIASDLLPFLPLALIITVFGVAVLIAQVAPSRVTSGVYQVTVGEGPTQFRLATESLTCSRTGDTATCTAPVAGQQLTIDIEYRGFDMPVIESTCTARHSDRPVPCTSMLAGYGHASNSVSISDSLGVTEPELTRLRDALPWWRTGNEPSLAGMALLCVLTGVAAGVAAYLFSKRTRPQATAWRFPIAAGTGLLGLALLAIGNLIIAPNTGHPALNHADAPTPSDSLGCIGSVAIPGLRRRQPRPRPALEACDQRDHRDHSLHRSRHIRLPAVQRVRRLMA